MARALAHRRPEHRIRRSVLFEAKSVPIPTVLGAVALFGTMAVAVSFSGMSETLRASSAVVGKGISLDLDMTIRTSLPSRYETTVLLENTAPVPLLLEYNASALANYEQRVRWRSDHGRIEREETALRNRFFPPSESAVSTIEAEVAFYAKREGKTLPTPIFTQTATLRVISPTPGRLLRNGEIGGFKIGDYPDPSAPGLRKNSYAALYPEKFFPPRAFYLVDDTSRDLRISRHRWLRDFALDYPWFSLGKRQYIALDYGLVRKAEDLIEEMNRAGLPGEKISIIYGFRPPAYNRDRAAQDDTESFEAPFSFHQYGKALDFILDADGDGRLDDLDGDGRVTVRDTAPIIRCVNALDRRYRSQGMPLYGGAGLHDHHNFRERPVQSPYVHMDVRGFLDEKGEMIRWPATWPDTGQPIAWGKW